MPVPVAPFVVMDFAFPVRAAGDDGDGSPAAQGRAQGIGIITLVGDQIVHRAGLFEKAGGCADIADIAGREMQSIGASDHIGQRVDFGRLAAARGTDRLGLRPPFPPKAERCALT